jgi:hypothetical protein
VTLAITLRSPIVFLRLDLTGIEQLGRLLH